MASADINKLADEVVAAAKNKIQKQTQEALDSIARWPDETAKAMGWEAAFRALRALARAEIRRLEKQKSRR